MWKGISFKFKSAEQSLIIRSAGVSCLSSRTAFPLFKDIILHILFRQFKQHFLVTTLRNSVFHTVYLKRWFKRNNQFCGITKNTLTYFGNPYQQQIFIGLFNLFFNL